MVLICWASQSVQGKPGSSGAPASRQELKNAIYALNSLNLNIDAFFPEETELRTLVENLCDEVKNLFTVEGKKVF